ncbi:MAG: histidine-type phosphatase [Dysgonamonadaceae bacterium]|jgi:hypothetical protein|nr:histidine-type phosphatase [Dysgonamonadaceae bacterium]
MKKMMHHTVIVLLCCLFHAASGQQARQEVFESLEKTGGVYYAYPHKNPKQGAAPEGYTPCYVSHYGRHGSRWLLSEKQYDGVLKILDDADSARALSPLGKDVHRRVAIVCRDGAGRAGELSPLGFRQQREIAGRMFRAFPAVFQGQTSVNARSTTVPRCMLSMMAFCDRMKELNPDISFAFQANAETSACLNPISRQHNPAIDRQYIDWMYADSASWRKEQRRFIEERLHVKRFVDALFADGEYAERSVEGGRLMNGLFQLASDVQNTGLDVSLYDVFEKEELYVLWLSSNFEHYALRGLYPPNRSYPARYASALVKDIVCRADSALQNGAPAADLRFGHDGSIMALAALLQLEGCDARETDPETVGQYWKSFRIAPMAANICLVFYKKDAASDILLKILHNEAETRIPVPTDIFPYYRWKDVKRFYIEKLDRISQKYMSTSYNYMSTTYNYMTMTYTIYVDDI